MKAVLFFAIFWPAVSFAQWNTGSNVSDESTSSSIAEAYRLRFGSAYVAKPFADHANFSIAYAAADLGNPESVFGHVFLVAHDGLYPEPQSPVLEFYGVTQGSNAALVRTLTDFIPGYFKVNAFAEKIRTYDLEGRDIFIRRIRAEVNAELFRHRIESTVGKEFPYDFLNVNCAYYIEWLLTANAQTFEKSWRIRQPMDVFLKFGDQGTEYMVRSTERQFSEFRTGDAKSTNAQALDYYEQRLVLRKFSAGSDVDSALRSLTALSQPESPQRPPDSTWARESLEVSVAARQKRITFSGFDTFSRQLGDPITSHSSLHVGRVHGICQNDGQCRSGVDVFDVSTHSRAGFGLAKVASLSTYMDRGLEFAGRIGLGLGYSVGDLSASITPVVGYDSRSELRVAWENQFSYMNRANSIKFTLHTRSSNTLDPILREGSKIQLQDGRGGFGISYSRTLGYALNYRWAFD